MERNNGQTIFLSVIGIATLLVAIIGATFAYFTTTINGTSSNATITTAQVGSVGFTTSSPSSENNILPGWEGSGHTSVYLTSSSTEAIPYWCTVSLENDSYATNVYVQTTSGSDAQVDDETALTTAGVVIARGTLQAETVESGETGLAHEVTYNVIFKEIGVPQDADQGQTIKTRVSCSIDTSRKYTANEYAANNGGAYGSYVEVECTHCSADALRKGVALGGNTSFTITPDEGYTLTGVEATGECTLTTVDGTEGTLSISNVQANTSCSVIAVEPGA